MKIEINASNTIRAKKHMECVWYCAHESVTTARSFRMRDFVVIVEPVLGGGYVTRESPAP